MTVIGLIIEQKAFSLSLMVIQRMQIPFFEYTDFLQNSECFSSKKRIGKLYILLQVFSQYNNKMFDPKIIVLVTLLLFWGGNCQPQRANPSNAVRNPEFLVDSYNPPVGQHSQQYRNGVILAWTNLNGDNLELSSSRDFSILTSSPLVHFPDDRKLCVLRSNVERVPTQQQLLLLPGAFIITLDVWGKSGNPQITSVNVKLVLQKPRQEQIVIEIPVELDGGERFQWKQFVLVQSPGINFYSLHFSIDFNPNDHVVLGVTNVRIQTLKDQFQPQYKPRRNELESSVSSLGYSGFRGRGSLWGLDQSQRTMFSLGGYGQSSSTPALLQRGGQGPLGDQRKRRDFRNQWRKRGEQWLEGRSGDKFSIYKGSFEPRGAESGFQHPDQGGQPQTSPPFQSSHQPLGGADQQGIQHPRGESDCQKHLRGVNLIRNGKFTTPHFTDRIRHLISSRSASPWEMTTEGLSVNGRYQNQRFSIPRAFLFGAPLTIQKGKQALSGSDLSQDLIVMDSSRGCRLGFSIGITGRFQLSGGHITFSVNGQHPKNIQLNQLRPNMCYFVEKNVPCNKGENTLMFVAFEQPADLHRVMLSNIQLVESTGDPSQETPGQQMDGWERLIVGSIQRPLQGSPHRPPRRPMPLQGASGGATGGDTDSSDDEPEDENSSIDFWTHHSHLNLIRNGDFKEPPIQQDKERVEVIPHWQLHEYGWIVRCVYFSPWFSSPNAFFFTSSEQGTSLLQRFSAPPTGKCILSFSYGTTQRSRRYGTVSVTTNRKLLKVIERSKLVKGKQLKFFRYFPCQHLNTLAFAGSGFRDEDSGILVSKIFVVPINNLHAGGHK